MPKQFDIFDRFSVTQPTKNPHRELINVNFKRTVALDGTMQMVDRSISPKHYVDMYSGDAVKLNGVDMTIPLPDVGATSMIYRFDGAETYTETPFYTLSTGGIWKDVFYFSDTLTPTEISKYSTDPNGFFEDVRNGVIDNCVLNMPLDGDGIDVYDYQNLTTYTVTNPTAAMRTDADNLNYGTQELNYLRDGLWRGDLSDYLECDGVGYVDTGWIPDANSDFALELDINADILHNDGTLSTVVFNGGVGSDRFGLLAKEGQVLLLNGTSSGGLKGTLNNELTKVMIVFTTLSGEWKMYVDGVLKETTSLGGYSNSVSTLKTSQYSVHISDVTIAKFKVHTDTTKGLENYLSQFA